MSRYVLDRRGGIMECFEKEEIWNGLRSREERSRSELICNGKDEIWAEKY